MSEDLLNVTNLVKNFNLRVNNGARRKKRIVQAVTNVSFSVGKGQTLGLVGESGSGKTTVGRCILRLIEPTSGTVEFEGQDLGSLKFEELRALRRKMQIVFQDPFASLDPRLPIGDAIAEPLRAFKVPRDQQDARISELLALVGLNPDHASRYPAEFSGGQRQRIAIARALALNPQLVVLDEPVSALDVSVRAGVLNLLAELQEKLGLSYLFVSHDLAVVQHVADDIAVMYLGSIVESGPVENVFANPQHPYTQALLSAVPIPDPKVEKNRKRIVLQGELPSPANPPSGCRFHNRCQIRSLLPADIAALCSSERPALASRQNGAVACHAPLN